MGIHDEARQRGKYLEIKGHMVRGFLQVEGIDYNETFGHAVYIDKNPSGNSDIGNLCYDILIFSNNRDSEKPLKDELRRNFKMKGEASSILGIRITQNEKYQLISIAHHLILDTFCSQENTYSLDKIKYHKSQQNEITNTLAMDLFT